MNELQDALGRLRHVVEVSDWDAERSVEDLRRSARLSLLRFELARRIREDAERLPQPGQTSGA